MGLIANLLGLSGGVREVAEVFTENRTKRAAQEHAEHIASLQQLGTEFARDRGGWFDQMIDGINRLPRPALAMGTLGLFVFAMADPVSFGVRMQGLALVPDQLWWLLGAIVSFYFGARELHHFRSRAHVAGRKEVEDVMQNIEALRQIEEPPQPQITDNPALAEWRDARGGSY